MSLAKKQIMFYQPTTVGGAINEGVRAVAERYNGTIQSALDHCVERVTGLTDAKLVRIKSDNPPGYTRDGQVFVTLLWVLLVDGMVPHRPAATVKQWFMGVINTTDLIDGDLHDDNLSEIITLFTESISFNAGFDAPDSDAVRATLLRVWATVPTGADNAQRLLPLLNRLFVGREADVAALRQRLGVDHLVSRHRLNILRGWPGVGKTALINTIAHDDAVRSAFAEGLLWASLGEHGDVLTTLQEWARQLGALHLLQLQTLPDLLNGMRATLTGRDILIIVDDIWTEVQGLYFKQVFDLQANTVLLTTRFTDVAESLQDMPEDVYVLEVLSEAHSIELLRILAPEPVRIYAERMPGLVRTMEGLPLALRVAGPTLQLYHARNFNVEELLDEFESSYKRFLESDAPSDRFDERTGKTPTIELLFERSVKTLDENGQMAFMVLGVFQHKPATFASDALQSVWEAEDPKVLITALIGRGLMDTADNGRYRVHQTLHMYANKLLDDYEGGLS